MWCCRCQMEFDVPAPPPVETYRGNGALLDFHTPVCPHCKNQLTPGVDTDSQRDAASIDDWESRLERELAEVQQLLAESSRLRESATRVDPPVKKVRDAAENSKSLKVDQADATIKTFGRMKRSAQNGMPRTPAIILLMIGIGLMSGPWIEGFESIGNHGLSLDWAGQLLLSVGGLLWLRDYIRQREEFSGKIDATIAGIHVLRREIATPPKSSDAHLQLADLKRRLAAVARSINF